EFTSIERTPGPDYEIETFDSVLTADTIWGPVQLSGPVTTRVSGGYSSGATGTFPAEIASMDLSGDLFGMLIEIRESPVLPSEGATTIDDLGGGLYQITSFFDVFTEVRIDSGPWDAQDSPAGHMELYPTGLSTGACCDPLIGECTETTEAVCTGDYLGDGTDCDPNRCVGACCRPDGSCLEDITSNACEAQWGGTWKGAATACAKFVEFVDCLAGPAEPVPPGNCTQWDLNSNGYVDLYDFHRYQREFTARHCVPAPTGACCATSGDCQQMNEWDCTSLHGPDAYQGDGTTCVPNPCPPPTGACCDPATGDCTETTQLECDGDYQGDGTTCDPNPCLPPPTGACCDPPETGDCTETSPGGCAGEYQGDGTTCSGNPCEYCFGPGVDCWLTSMSCSSDDTVVSFAEHPIPADFFCAGSMPYSGDVLLRTLDLGPPPVPDTEMERLGELCFPRYGLPANDSTSIRLNYMRMLSCVPLSTTCGNWDVYVYLSSTPVLDGQMTATMTNSAGGTFDGFFWVQPRYRFYNSSLGWRTLDTGQQGIPPIQMQIEDVAWYAGEDWTDECSTHDDGFQVPPEQQYCHSSYGTAEHRHCVSAPGY
ncbi:MAG: hypothetical protein GY842_14950, partial [bacterium]|nr:hypothetical protein [bacterium]